jgi:hypothetical protein
VGTGILVLGLLLIIAATFVGGVPAGFVTGIGVGGVLLLLLIRDQHGRSIGQQVLNRSAFAWTRLISRSTVYRSGPLGRAPWGTYQLPGLAAPSKVSEWRDGYDRPFALIHVPFRRHYTVVFATEPDGASLVDEDQVDSWVAHWGAWLAGLGNEAGVVAAAVTIETAPDSGSRLAQEVGARIDPDAPALAKAMLREVVDTYPAGSATIRAWVSVTFSAMRAGGRKRSEEEMGRDLAARLPGLTQGLASTGAGSARPVTAQQLCEAVRTAYDPPAAKLIDQAYAEGSVPTLRWSDVGPTAAQAAWDHYRHDGAWSVSWTMSQAPRGEVYSSVLQSLLKPHPDIDRKRITLLYRPLSAAMAARVVEQDKRNADFRASVSDRPSARTVADQRSAAAAAREEARGAGVVNFAMIITATVTDHERLPDARAAIDFLTGDSRLLARIAYGSQDSAFAAGLPVGVVVNEHIRIPREIREGL